jgi:hypothetical protein
MRRMLTEGAAVRVWWQQDRQWHAGRVTLVSEGSGEFLVDYDAEDDGEGWVSTSHEWEAVSAIVPSDDNHGPPQLTGLAVIEQATRAFERATTSFVPADKAETFVAAAEAAPFVPEDLDPFTDRVLIEERFAMLYEETVRLHGDTLAEPEARFGVLLASIESREG